MKNQKCKNCGCVRKLMIKAKVREQGPKDTQAEFGLAWLCIPCLIKVVGLTDDLNLRHSNHYDHHKAMEVV